MKLEEEEEEEMDKLLDEIPHATSPDHHHHHHHHRHHPIPHADASTIGNDPGNARRGPPGHHDMYASAAPPQPYSLGNGLMRGSSEPGRCPMMEEIGLLDRLQDMHLGNGGGEARVGRPGNGLADPYPLRSGCSNAGVRGPFEDDYGVVRRSVLPGTVLFDGERSLPGLVPQQHCSNLWDSQLQTWGSNTPVAYPAGVYLEWEDVLNSQLGGNGGIGRNYYQREIYDDNSAAALYRPSVVEAFPQQGGVDFNQNLGFVNSQMLPVLHGRAAAAVAAAALSNGWAPQQSLPPMRNLRNLEAFDCEDSLIIQGKGLRFARNNGPEFQRVHRRLPQLDDRLHVRGRSVGNVDGVRSPGPRHSPFLPLKYENLMDVEEYIYHIAKDQQGCRFLQQKFDKGEPHEVDMIFNGIINHVVELMVNPFANYLMQKLLEVCTEEQRMKILLVLTEDPAELLRISLNMHGTRPVQKLIDSLKTPQQIALVISALKPGFLDLVKDFNGNHVVQHCLQNFSPEDNKFIFDSAAEHCVEIATHRHGCCVLQRCISHATGEDRANMVAEIAANGLPLAQDAYGNYVVQYILELEDSPAAANLASQFEGHYVNLSTQKFSSNVVEKCLKIFKEQDRARIIYELLSVPRFEQLLQDPYANYVIQSALGNSRGSLHDALVEAIRPHATALRTNPHCKRIFSRMRC